MTTMQPQDRTVDRRAFLARTAALTAAATIGSTVALPSIAVAAPDTTSGGNPVKWNSALDKSNAYTKPRPEAVADPTELTISEAAWLIRAGKLTPQQLVEAYLARIEAYDGTYKAFNLVLADAAIQAARDAARKPRRGALHGIPLAIKDNYYTEGVPTTANSYLFQDFVPPFDATSVAKLKVNGGDRAGQDPDGTAGHHPGHHPGRRGHHGQRLDADQPGHRSRRLVHRHRRPRWPAGWPPPASAPRPAARSPRRRTRRT